MSQGACQAVCLITLATTLANGGVEWRALPGVGRWAELSVQAGGRTGFQLLEPIELGYLAAAIMK